MIFLTALILRFWQLPQRVIFTEDHAWLATIAYKNIIYHEPLLMGSSIGGVWATFPPTYAYLTTFLLKITNFDYYILHNLTATANVLAIVLMIVCLPRLLGRKAAILTVFLYSLSFFVVSGAIVGLNPGAIPPLTVILVITTILYFRDKKLWALPIAVATISLMTHLHVTPFFLIPGLILLPILYLRDLRLKNLIVIALSGLIFLYLGVRPHYLENKAFGGQNVVKVVNAIKEGGSGNAINKFQSLLNFGVSLTRINGDLLFPDPRGWQDQSPTSPPVAALGMLLTLGAIAWSLRNLLISLKKPSANAIVAILFLSYLIFQALIPSYGSASGKPFRWLDSVYFPLFFLTLSDLLLFVFSLIKIPKIKVLLGIIAISAFIITNLVKWSTDAQIENRMKLMTIKKLVALTIPNITKDDKYNFIHIGSVNSNPTWPFSFVLWKETGQSKFLRLLLWNVGPNKNEPFYIFVSHNEPAGQLENSEKVARSFQDRPQVLNLGEVEDYFVEKIYDRK
ncbi:MAG: hypothetical protein NT141_03025 [candidate division WWE3 bacterium]|nr:hypothetical protein [candidate division WWE3 bacterium]